MHAEFVQAASARSHMPASQRERLALLGKLEQIPLKVRALGVLVCNKHQLLAGYFQVYETEQSLSDLLEHVLTEVSERKQVSVRSILHR